MRRITRGVALATLAVAMIAALGPTARAGDELNRGKGGIATVRGVKPRFWGASNSVLRYHGGAIMHTNTTFAIYWSPRGSVWQNGYMGDVDDYFRDVAADSGSGDNVYSVETQYDGTNGHVAYRSRFAGSYVDTAPFPDNGCPAYGGYDVCLTDAQVIDEVHRLTDSLGLPEDGSHAYFLFTPKDVGGCFDEAGTICAFQYYCAYHGFDDDLIYANMPYAATLPAGCGLTGPNGSDADSEINVTSHEHREQINDPYLDAWWDNKGYEGSDKCAWTFGAVAPSGPGTYNQVINGERYLLQREWSNATKSCQLHA